MSYPPPPYQPYPAGPGNPAGPTRLRGRTLLRLALIFFVLAVIGFVIGGVILAKKSLGQVNSFQRISFASGGGSVTLNGTGKWIGYYEASNVSNSISEIPAFAVVIVGPSGSPVTYQPYGNRSDGNVTKLTYGYNHHNGAAAFQFTASTSGTYRIAIRAGSSVPSDADVAIGRDIVAGTIAGGVLIGGGVLLLITAVILFIIGLVRRSRHKRELRDAASYGYGSGYPPGYQQGYQQGPPPGYPQGYQQGPEQRPSGTDRE